VTLRARMHEQYVIEDERSGLVSYGISSSDGEEAKSIPKRTAESVEADSVGSECKV